MCPRASYFAGSTIAYPGFAYYLDIKSLFTLFIFFVGIDDHLKTPYSIAADFSIQRQLPGGWTLDSYGGRLTPSAAAVGSGRTDRLGGPEIKAWTISTAATRMSKFAIITAKIRARPLQPIPFFESIFPTAAAGGFSATQNILREIWVALRTLVSVGLGGREEKRSTISPGGGRHRRSQWWSDGGLRWRTAAAVPLLNPQFVAVCMVFHRDQQLQRRSVHLLAAPVESRAAGGVQLYLFEIAGFGLGHGAHEILRAPRLQLPP